jgi:hypothetical protein
MKSPVDVLIRVVAPAGMALTDAPWWIVVGMFLLALAHRILPRESKDLLTLWLRIIPCRHYRSDETDNERGHDRHNGRRREVDRHG